MIHLLPSLRVLMNERRKSLITIIARPCHLPSSAVRANGDVNSITVIFCTVIELLGIVNASICLAMNVRTVQTIHTRGSFIIMWKKNVWKSGRGLEEPISPLKTCFHSFFSASHCVLAIFHPCVFSAHFLFTLLSNLSDIPVPHT